MFLRWAIVLGIVGLSTGFIGPIVLSPESNQGPLLGIFISGPAGTLLGAVLGALNEAELFQRGQMFMHGGGGTEMKMVADLLNRGSITMLLDVAL